MSEYNKSDRGKKKIITINLPIWMIETMKTLTDAGVFQSRSEIVRFVLMDGLHKFIGRQQYIRGMDTSNMKGVVQSDIEQFQTLLEDNFITEKISMSNFATVFPEIYEKIKERKPE